MVQVSVLEITVRWGGLEEQIKYLARQTHSISEFVVVDGWFDQRHAAVMSLASSLGLNLVHLREPQLSYNTYPNRCSNINFAIAHARYPLCVFIDDWHVIPDDFIESHVKMYKAGFAGVVRWIHTPFMMPMEYNEFQDRVWNLPPPTMDEAIKHFKMKEHLPFSEERGREWIALHSEDTRIHILQKDHLFVKGNIITNIHDDWWWPNSASAPLRALISVNGFSESFNGGTGGEDVDCATRMSRIGVKFALDTRVTVYHINHLSIPQRPVPQPLCSFHDRAPFTNNEYYQGDAALRETEQLRTWECEGIRVCQCKLCGWRGIVDSNELLALNRTILPILAPTESLGIKRTNIVELRRELGIPDPGDA